MSNKLALSIGIRPIGRLNVSVDEGEVLIHLEPASDES